MTDGTETIADEDRRGGRPCRPAAPAVGAANCPTSTPSRWRSWGGPTGCRTWCAPASRRPSPSFGLDRGEFDVIATLAPFRAALPADADGAVHLADDLLGRPDPQARPAGEERADPREKSPHDGRSVLVALTEAGVARAEKAFRDGHGERILVSAGPGRKGARGARGPAAKADRRN